MLPTLFTIGNLTIFSYPVFLGIALATAYLFTEYNFEINHFKKTKFNLLFFCNVAFAWLGAKTLFLLSTPSEQMKIASNLNFWLGGGFVFYGGLLGIILFFSILIFLKKITIKEIVLFLPGFILGHAAGRIGCFLAGCCYGKITTFPISFHMHYDQRHPVQLYESFFLIILSIFIIKLLKVSKHWPALLLYITGYSFIRFGLEFIRGDNVRGTYNIAVMQISTSQIIALVLIFLSFFFYLRFFRFSVRRT